MSSTFGLTYYWRYSHEKEGNDFDPPGPDSRIGSHYFHTWCPSVKKTRDDVKTKHVTTLIGAWWTTKFARLVFILFGQVQDRTTDVHLLKTMIDLKKLMEILGGI